MTENITFSLEALFEEIVALGLQSAVTTEEAYHSLVEDVIEDHRRLGEIHDDQNTEGYETVLKDRWPEYRERIVE